MPLVDRVLEHAKPLNLARLGIGLAAAPFYVAARLVYLAWMVVQLVAGWMVAGWRLGWQEASRPRRG